ncbi:hypothetical protein [Vacuolonema iberomarrocanum]|uniref:hypothetical protein n=1 Tax=Vacuolonema iberomarrocanum TaxID=3454632 RepID=UPI001A0BCDBD|nr:hypothetical protein [filamentous cyanobacterium LEGE 07170]
MPINLSIQADIIDIRSDVPRREDIFLVDTNVWLWQTYTNAVASSRNASNKIQSYTPYLRRARQNGATLVYSGLILAELAHVIEKTERKIYNRRTGSSLESKEYRHNNSTERANVVAEVESAWRQVEGLAVPIDLLVNEDITNSSLLRFRTQALDGYDLLILEAISRSEAGQVKVITDDMDYAVVPGIQVFTNNGLAIQQANVQRKLLTIR